MFQLFSLKVNEPKCYFGSPLIVNYLPWLNYPFKYINKLLCLTNAHIQYRDPQM